MATAARADPWQSLEAGTSLGSATCAEGAQGLEPYSQWTVALSGLLKGNCIRSEAAWTKVAASFTSGGLTHYTAVPKTSALSWLSVSWLSCYIAHRNLHQVILLPTKLWFGVEFPVIGITTLFAQVEESVCLDVGNETVLFCMYSCTNQNFENVSATQRSFILYLCRCKKG